MALLLLFLIDTFVLKLLFAFFIFLIYLFIYFLELGGRKDLRQLGLDAEGGERAPERVVRGRLQVPEDGFTLRCDGENCQSGGKQMKVHFASKGSFQEKTKIVLNSMSGGINTQTPSILTHFSFANNVNPKNTSFKHINIAWQISKTYTILKFQTENLSSQQNNRNFKDLLGLLLF